MSHIQTSQLALLVSFAAVAFTAANYFRSWNKDKRDLFLRIHESLVHPDLVKGRRLLYKLEKASDADSMGEDDQTLVYRALAQFDVLAMYAENGWIDRETVLAEWGNSLRRSYLPSKLFIEARYWKVKWHSWPHYMALAEEAWKRPDPADALVDPSPTS